MLVTHASSFWLRLCFSLPSSLVSLPISCSLLVVGGCTHVVSLARNYLAIVVESSPSSSAREQPEARRPRLDTERERIYERRPREQPEASQARLSRQCERDNERRAMADEFAVCNLHVHV